MRRETPRLRRKAPAAVAERGPLRGRHPGSRPLSPAPCTLGPAAPARCPPFLSRSQCALPGVRPPPPPPEAPGMLPVGGTHGRCGWSGPASRCTRRGRRRARRTAPGRSTPRWRRSCGSGRRHSPGSKASGGSRRGTAGRRCGTGTRGHGAAPPPAARLRLPQETAPGAGAAEPPKCLVPPVHLAAARPFLSANSPLGSPSPCKPGRWLMAGPQGAGRRSSEAPRPPAPPSPVPGPAQPRARHASSSGARGRHS